VNYTKRQHTLLKFIIEYQRSNEGLSPTLGEMADHMGVSKVTVFEHLATLKAKGAITTERRKSRSVRVLDSEFGHVPGTIPLLGRISAGAALEALEVPATFSIEDKLPAGPGFYVLEVRGNSMVDEGIHDGDFVFVRETTTARNGETVVAIINDDEATLKTFYKEGRRIRLQPANASMDPILVDECEIRGIVVGVYRKLD
jgi:repressor LexA